MAQRRGQGTNRPLHAQEVATEKFKEIQNAYAVLSDRHERSWYDQHRESILRGGRGCGGGGGGGDDSDEEEGGIDLWPLFSSSAFEGFGGGKGGFYAVYAEAFCTLEQEENAVRESGGDYTTRDAAGAFGGATSEWAAVRGLGLGELGEDLPCSPPAAPLQPPCSPPAAPLAAPLQPRPWLAGARLLRELGGFRHRAPLRLRGQVRHARRAQPPGVLASPC